MTEPAQPSFEAIPDINSWKYGSKADGLAGYQNLLQDLKDELNKIKTNPHVHDVAGVAINQIIQKVMPYIQNYNMEYTQGGIANGQKAATYALDMTNYISSQYQAVGAGTPVIDPTTGKPSDPTTDPNQPAKNAIKAINDYTQFLKDTKTASTDMGVTDPFGTMGDSIGTSLSSITQGKTEQSQAGDLESYWKGSWVMTSEDSKGNVKSNAENSAIMQDVNGAQNQAQSEAAYLQSESKIANENYQQYTATAHDAAQNVVNVEKASVTASQSAGN